MLSQVGKDTEYTISLPPQREKESAESYWEEENVHRSRVVPPAVSAEVAKSTVDQAGYQLATGDEERVDGDQLASLVGWRNFRNVYGNRHRSNS